ncbi:MAG TPA: TrbI/VirB10 family protein [Sphingomonas sp.]
MAAPDSNESPADPAEAERDIRPVVEKPRRGVSGVVMGLSALIAAVVLFVILDSRRLALTAPATLPQSTLALESAAPPPLYVPPQPTPSPVASSTPLPTPEPPPQPAPPPPAPQIVYMPSPVAPPQTPAPPPRNLAAPALVVDTGGNANATANPSPGAAGALGTGDPAQSSTGRVRAAMFSGRSTTVPQGTLIPAILETALDSSHAGFARALVQRDIRGFDGTKILIPRGSRLIGQYAGNAAQGQNRAFIIWQRLIRPDGVTIALDSPAADPVGSGGIKAHVNSHFFARFSGAILQSVLDLGVNLASRSTHSPVVVVLPGSFQGTTSTVVQPSQIAPTLKVKPGTSISVFVARDLDFGGTSNGDGGQ